MQQHSLSWIDREEMFKIPAMEFSNSTSLHKSPVVSVLMMTRNHEKYLKEAVESVVCQVCNFPVEIIIGEDFSTDATRVVARQLVHKYPLQLRLITAKENVGITANFLRLVVRAKGKYVALLEGDDYWTDSKKLQLQLDLLESHPEYAWCAAGTDNRETVLPEMTYYTLDDILRRYPVHTSVVMFRRKDLKRYPRFPDTVCWDSMLFSYLTDKGQCGLVPKVMSYYRRHEGGLWNNANRMHRVDMSRICIDAINNFFNGQYSEQLVDRELWLYERDINLNTLNGFWKYWLGSIRIAASAFRRVWKNAPVRYVTLWGRIALQPIIVPLALLRQRLGLGKYFLKKKTQ